MVPYTASLNMFTPPNTHILTVTAHDSDLGSNGEVEYSLQAPVRSSEILEVTSTSEDLTEIDVAALLCLSLL